MRITAVLFGCACVLGLVFPARARAGLLDWEALPDSVLVDSVRAIGPSFEERWNTSLVTILRRVSPDARFESDPGSRSLIRIAQTGLSVPGVSVASAAIERARGWTVAQRAQRIVAHEADSLAERAGTLSEVLENFSRATESYRDVGERRWFAVRLGRMGNRVLALGQLQTGSAEVSAAHFAAADSLYREALRLRMELADSLLIGNALQSIALANDALSRPDSAEKYYRESYRLRLQSGQREAALRAYAQLAISLYRQGRLVAAVSACDSALGMGLPSTREDEVRKTRLDALLELARFDEAQVEARALLLRAASEADPARERMAQLDLGRVLMRAHLDEEALRVLSALRSQARKAGDTTVFAKASNNLALLHLRRGERVAAARVLAEAWRVVASPGRWDAARDITVTLADLAGASGRMRERARFLRAADSIHVAVQGQSRLEDEPNLGWAALFEGRSLEAREHFAAALARAEREKKLEIVQSALLGLGELAQRSGDLEAALRFDQQAAVVMDSARARQRRDGTRIALLGGKYEPYEAVIDLLGRKCFAGDTLAGSEAFEFAERSRARSLDDLLEANGLPPASSREFSIEHVQRLLKTHEALLYYAVGDSVTTLWVIRRDGWQLFRLPKRALLRNMVMPLERQWSRPATAGSARARELAGVVARAILRPAMDRLRSVKSLRIITDDVLTGLPFEALPIGRSTGRRDSMRLVIDRFVVSYPPSARWLLETRSSASSGRLVALGDPEFAGVGAEPLVRLAPLPGTRREVTAIRHAAAGRPVVELIGTEARWSNLLRSAAGEPPRLVHLGTHGQVSSVSSDGVVLWFAPEAGGSPRRVGLAEVMRSSLRAELVSLAACESSLGRYSRGEGVLGLPRALLGNGCESVLASSWKVDDSATLQLFESFYGFWLKEELPAAEALARAKRRLIHELGASSPYYWAAFTLQGR